MHCHSIRFSFHSLQFCPLSVAYVQELSGGCDSLHPSTHLPAMTFSSVLSSECGIRARIVRRMWHATPLHTPACDDILLSFVLWVWHTCKNCQEDVTCYTPPHTCLRWHSPQFCPPSVAYVQELSGGCDMLHPYTHLPAMTFGSFFETVLRRDFFGVESYQWLKHWHSSGYPARCQAL